MKKDNKNYIHYYGGMTSPGVFLDSMAIYCVEENSWNVLNITNGPVGRGSPTFVKFNSVPDSFLIAGGGVFNKELTVVQTFYDSYALTINQTSLPFLVYAEPIVSKFN